MLPRNGKVEFNSPPSSFPRRCCIVYPSALIFSFVGPYGLSSIAQNFYLQFDNENYDLGRSFIGS